MSIVIVGAGQAGGWVAQTLRDSGFKGAITLIGDEPHAPYERPPLSKGLLNGREAAPTYVIDENTLHEQDINFVRSTNVASIDRGARSVTCQDGSTYFYNKLVLTTGGRPRPLPFSIDHLSGVHTLRTLYDASAISAGLSPGKHLLIIGGGWIGLEVAATAREKGLTVTIVEAADRLCARSLPAEISEFLLREHLRNGVEVVLSRCVRALNQHDDGRIVAEIDGMRVPLMADMVLVGIGLVPNMELAQAAGLAVSNGIEVDEQGRTSDENIYAAGDVTCFSSRWASERLRLESWANAQNQGIVVGRAIAGEHICYDDIPWFWSDQYDLQVQMIGLSRQDASLVLRGSLSDRKFTLFQVNGNKITAAVSVNSPRDMKQVKRLMKKGAAVNVADLADLSKGLNTQ
jgi:3-phenylpropionate/trans-cinnamate dioxygenase ferredoxin reductase subunit